MDGCTAAANLKGAHIPCDLGPNHSGWAHSNSEYGLIWQDDEHDQQRRPVVPVGVCGVPDEAVEAAAAAVVDEGPTEKATLRVGRKRAEAALAAAVPHVREAIAREIEALQIEPTPNCPLDSSERAAQPRCPCRRSHRSRRLPVTAGSGQPDPKARIRDEYWTLPCGDGCYRGRYTYGCLRRFWLCRGWWKPSVAWVAFRPRRCVACKGTGRVIVTLAASS